MKTLESIMMVIEVEEEREVTLNRVLDHYRKFVPYK